MIPNPNISFQNVINTLPKSNLQLTPQLAENLRAIFSPNEVLAEKQQQLIAQLSQFKTEELSGDMAVQAATEIDALRSDMLNMLKQNKRMKQLNFTTQQQAELKAKRTKLAQDINYAKGLINDYPTTTGRAASYLDRQMIDPEVYAQVVGIHDTWKKEAKEGKSLGDWTDPNALMAKNLASKPQKEIEQKQLNSFWETILNPIQDRYFQLPKKEIRSLFESQVSGEGAWQQTRQLHEALGYVKPEDDDATAKNKIIDILEKRWKPRKYPVSSGKEKDSKWLYYFDPEEDADVYTPKTELVRTLKVDGKESKTRLLRRHAYRAGGGEWDALIEEEQPADYNEARMKAYNLPYKTKKVWVEKKLDEGTYPHLKQYFDGEEYAEKETTQRKEQPKDTNKAKVYIGSNGTEYTEDQLSDIDIQKAIKDDKLKVK